MDNAVLEIIEYVSVKGHLKSHVIKNKIIELISDRIKCSVPNLVTLAKDLELLKLVCLCVENTVKKKHKLDKKEIVMSIMKTCFPILSDAELKVIESNIEVLHQNKLIKKVTYAKKLWRYVFSNKKKDL